MVGGIPAGAPPPGLRPRPGAVQRRPETVRYGPSTAPARSLDGPKWPLGGQIRPCDPSRVLYAPIRFSEDHRQPDAAPRRSPPKRTALLDGPLRTHTVLETGRRRSDVPTGAGDGPTGCGEGPRRVPPQPPDKSDAGWRRLDGCGASTVSRTLSRGSCH
ncbi:hypothetical protein M885DRAFT_523197 [Pelagophyceae sp. CCMP2097]|nr:hypothetical protein M885DRAFT_523197 [Pelagophyceae sp. CCMP2097]